MTIQELKKPVVAVHDIESDTDEVQSQIDLEHGEKSQKEQTAKGKALKTAQLQDVPNEVECNQSEEKSTNAKKKNKPDEPGTSKSLVADSRREPAEEPSNKKTKKAPSIEEPGSSKRLVVDSRKERGEEPASKITKKARSIEEPGSSKHLVAYSRRERGEEPAKKKAKNSTVGYNSGQSKPLSKKQSAVLPKAKNPERLEEVEASPSSTVVALSSSRPSKSPPTAASNSHQTDGSITDEYNDYLGKLLHGTLSPDEAKLAASLAHQLESDEDEQAVENIPQPDADDDEGRLSDLG
jgi:hypothetical protein